MQKLKRNDPQIGQIFRKRIPCSWNLPNLPNLRIILLKRNDPQIKQIRQIIRKRILCS